MGTLEGRRAIITAGANGIGRAIVKRYAAEGASVVFCDIDEVGGARLASELGEAVRFCRTDCADVAAVRHFVEDAIADGVDVLVNNAGVAISKTILDLTDEEFDLTMAVNLKSAFAATQIVARRMIPRPGEGLDHQHVLGQRGDRDPSHPGLQHLQGRPEPAHTQHRGRPGRAWDQGERHRPWNHSDRSGAAIDLHLR